MLALETVRQEWEAGNRRFEELMRDPVARPRLLTQLEVVTDELRKRVGQTFTLDELAAAYARADDWVREAVDERAGTPGWPRTVSLVQDAAFHLYQRGAVDYKP
ncbi:MAG: hypothetical protein WAQ33_09915 [Gaiellaceae bacterium]